jgi:hypothetical protein
MGRDEAGTLARPGFAKDDGMVEAIPADRPTNLSSCPFCEGERGAVG